MVITTFQTIYEPLKHVKIGLTLANGYKRLVEIQDLPLSNTRANNNSVALKLSIDVKDTKNDVEKYSKSSLSEHVWRHLVQLICHT